MIDLIVLGTIPGTDFQLTIKWVITLCLFLVLCRLLKVTDEATESLS